MEIGQVIRSLRKERGLSQYDVERLSGGKIPRYWINSLEHGDIKNPPQAKLAALSKVLGVTITDVYERAGIIEIPTDLPPSKRALLDAFDRLPPSLQKIAINLVRQLDADNIQELKDDNEK